MILVILRRETTHMAQDNPFQIRGNNRIPKQGDILISEPLMDDENFGRSVILLIESNDEEGSLGIIMNKTLRVKLNQIVETFSDFDAPVYHGGPVAENQIFYIHTLGDVIPESIPIMEGLWWGGDSETLDTLISTGIANRDNVKFFLGYSGWDAGQLKGELQGNSWLVSHATPEFLMGTNLSTMWQTAVDMMGEPYKMWKRFPKNAEDN